MNNRIVATTTATGAWYHLVLTYDGTNIEGWINGQSQGTLDASGNGTAAQTSGLNILSSTDVDPGYNNQYWDGLVDEVGIWSKKLSNQEISDLYNNGSGQTLNVSSRIPGRVYAASAANATHSNAFVGFSVATTTTGDSGSVIIGGLAQVSTSLSAGKQYYLSNSSGVLSTTPGTVTRKVGIGVSTTTLLITNVW